jgi:hypothetical protein
MRSREFFNYFVGIAETNNRISAEEPKIMWNEGEGQSNRFPTQDKDK